MENFKKRCLVLVSQTHNVLCVSVTGHNCICRQICAKDDYFVFSEKIMVVLFQTDLFGLAGTIYVLLHGQYMKVYQEAGEWKTSSNFDRFVYSQSCKFLTHSMTTFSVNAP